MLLAQDELASLYFAHIDDRTHFDKDEPFNSSEVTEKDVRTSGERRLLKAILQMALVDAVGSTRKSYKCRNARNWLKSESKRKWGCKWVCEHLDLNHAKVRSWLSQFSEYEAHSPEAFKVLVSKVKYCRRRPK